MITTATKAHNPQHWAIAFGAIILIAQSVFYAFALYSMKHLIDIEHNITDKLVNNSYEAKYQVSQTQQYLTDAGLTFSLDAIADGLTSSQKAILALQSIVEVDPSYAEQSDSLKTQITNFYNTGLRMIEGYKKNQVSGNLIMKSSDGFDEQSLKISTHLDQLVQSIHDKQLRLTNNIEKRVSYTLGLNFIGTFVLLSLLALGSRWLLMIQKKNRHESNQLNYRKMIDASPIPCGMYNSDQQINYLNSTFTADLGYTLQDIPTVDDWWQLSCPDEKARSTTKMHWDTQIEQLNLDHSHSFCPIEMVVRCKNGNTRMMHLTASILLEEGNSPNYLVALYDMTEIRRAQNELLKYKMQLEILVDERTRELKNNQERLQLLEKNVRDYAIIMLDVDGNIKTWSAGSQHLKGYQATEVIGRHFSIFYTTEDLAAGKPNWELQIVQQEGQYEDQGWRIRKDGTAFWANVLITALYNEEGILRGYAKITRNISKQREFEQSLKCAQEAAEKLAQNKSDFLANMSHEIRTPLNGILGFARMGARDSYSRKIQKTFLNIIDSGQHLLGVINDVLDFSKIEAGKIILDPHPFSLISVIDEAISYISEQARQKGIVLKVAFTEEINCWVQGDSLRLRQILLNLLSNAIKFTERGSVILDVCKHNENTQFKVTDTGIGMTEEQLSRLFSAFEQADSSTTRKYGGTGLGLVVSRHLAQIMGGNITVTSELGKGSVFELQLPLGEAEAIAPHYHWVDNANPRLISLRVLAAEDIQFNRMILEDVLKNEGAEVVFAENGQQALESVEQYGLDYFHLVLMDIQMPQMDGYEATRRIRILAPDLPIIGLTAHAMAEERVRCIEAGMLDRVTKPIEVDELVNTILRYLPAHVSNNSDFLDIDKPVTVTSHKESLTLTASESDSPGTCIEIDWDALLRRYDGRNSFVRTLLETVLEDHQTESVETLNAAIAAHDHDQIRFVAHSLKGLGGSIEAHDFQLLAQRTEQAAKFGDGTASFELAMQLANRLNGLLTEIENLIQTPREDV